MSKNDHPNDYLEMTKYRNLSPSGQQQGLTQPPLELPCDPRLPRITLPAPSVIDLPDLSLREAVEKRITRRDYAKKQLSLDTFGD